MAASPASGTDRASLGDTGATVSAVRSGGGSWLDREVEVLERDLAAARRHLDPDPDPPRRRIGPRSRRPVSIAEAAVAVEVPGVGADVARRAAGRAPDPPPGRH